ncbi:MAG TPA: FAD-dependent oxidoreductase [Ramlibacter sp.]|uniref:FAD-dependent oxidoreductase n=1 Tax=Ramlibacter sp. TaxID=1917967 RepID=UPI002B8F5EFC|nr:FAD-dependent oxidoreductase [Ramlibacter sp.]HVZ45800.1 FAD-dependent oxidoreductase [Ramlibacter sp.]
MPTEFALQADVVVVGAGLAGNAAALAAAEAGATVCLLEKGRAFGGSSVLAGGGLAFAGTDMQQALGMQDSVEALRRDLLETGAGRNDPQMLQAYLDHQLATFEWLRERGVDFKLAPATLPGGVNRIHGTEIGEVTRVLHGRVLAHPKVVYARNARVHRLLRSAVGRVHGARAEIEGREVGVQAHRGVVLASGGFVRNAQLLCTFAPQWIDAIKMGGRDNTGDGFLMACALGAGLADMAYIEATLGASLDRYPDLAQREGDSPSLLFPVIRGAILVNLDARRFANESLNYKVLGAAGARQPKGVAFQIFDRKVMERSLPSPAPANYKEAHRRGIVRAADSVAALALGLGLDAARLRETIDRYNTAALNGADPEHGRPIPDYGTPGGACIDTPPFYAFACAAALTTTYCGIRTDARMRVRDVWGEPIPGLYAAGEVTGGFHGAAYLSGTALGKAAVHGRLAGLACAQDLSQDPRHDPRHDPRTPR